MDFFGKKWRIASISGFPIEVNISFLILLVLVFLTRGGLVGVFLTGLTFASVLLHELGHAVTARRLGVHIAGIELQFFGGMAKMVTPPRSARDEILIALMGPAVSLGLALVTLPLASVLGSSLLLYVGLTNLILGAFNLLPALPMDGGRVYRAYRAQRVGVLTATQQAVTLSKYIAFGLGLLGLFAGQFFMVALAIMLYFMAKAELLTAFMLRYNDAPAEPIDYEVLDATGRVIYDPRGYYQGYDVYEEQFGPVRRVVFRPRRW